jgi:hypothetical protein
MLRVERTKVSYDEVPALYEVTFGFSSGPLESLVILPILSPGPSTNFSWPFGHPRTMKERIEEVFSVLFSK